MQATHIHKYIRTTHMNRTARLLPKLSGLTELGNSGLDLGLGKMRAVMGPRPLHHPPGRGWGSKPFSFVAPICKCLYLVGTSRRQPPTSISKVQILPNSSHTCSTQYLCESKLTAHWARAVRGYFANMVSPRRHKFAA